MSSDHVADAQAVGGRALVSAEGHAERGCALHAEVVQLTAFCRAPTPLGVASTHAVCPCPGPSNAMMSNGRVGDARVDLLRANPSNPFIMMSVCGVPNGSQRAGTASPSPR